MGTALAGVILQRGLERFAIPIEAYQMVYWVFAGVALLGIVVAWNFRDV